MLYEVQALPHYIHKIELLQLQHLQMFLMAWFISTTMETFLNSYLSMITFPRYNAGPHALFLKT